MKNNQEDKVNLKLWISSPIKFYLNSKYPQVEGFVDVILSDLIEYIKQSENVKRVHKNKIKSSLEIALLNLYSAHLSNPKKYVAYPRGNNKYSKDGSRYKRQDIGYDTFVKRVINSLRDLGYIEDHTGFYDKEFRYGMNSRMRASSKLSKLFTEHKLAGVMVGRDTSEEVIVLKDSSIDEHYRKTKSIIEYEDTEMTNQMRENLHNINYLLDSQYIDLEVSDKVLKKINKKLSKKKNKEMVDFTRKKLKRIFNNSSFENGGRFYHGWWQEIPKEYRDFIRINDKKTTEVDYSSIHPRILYAKEGIDLGNTDPYIIEGYEDDRDTIKVALNIILNAETKDKAISAIYKHDDIDIDKKTAQDIYQKLEESHPMIQKYFGSGEGVRLQYIDAQMAEKVMLNLAKYNIVALPVHDSFIVRSSHRVDLLEEMDKAFEEVVGIKPKRDIKGLKLGKKVAIKEAERFYGDIGEWLYDEEGNLEGIIIKASSTYELINKRDKEYQGYHLRRGEWIEHKGYI